MQVGKRTIGLSCLALYRISFDRRVDSGGVFMTATPIKEADRILSGFIFITIDFCRYRGL